MVCLRASTGLSSRLASSSSLADIQAWRPGCPGATRCSQWLIVSLLAYAATTDRGSLPAPSWLGGEGPCLLGVEVKFTPSLVLVLQLLSIEKAA